MSISIFNKSTGIVPISSAEDIKYVTVSIDGKKDSSFSFPILSILVKHTSDIAIQKTLSNGLIVSDFGKNPCTIVLTGLAQGKSCPDHDSNVLIKDLIAMYNKWIKDRTKLITITVGGHQYKGIVLSFGYSSYKLFLNILVYSMSFLGYDINV